jgi:EAL domain-containing protein (putative c-di-GMP-specific phosphodiesterase class I)
MEITSTHIALIAAVKPRTIPWRKLTIAVDGFDGSGKSTLARFLAWQLGMPAVETDMVLRAGCSEPTPDLERLRHLIESRHSLNRPVIVEGVFVLRTLQQLEIVPEFLIRVESAGCEGSISWARQFEMYSKEHPRASAPNFLFSRVLNDTHFT